MIIMKYVKHTTAIFLLITATSTLNARLVIEDFEGYPDTKALQADVFSFGTAAQAGKPSLALGLGENNSNAACFNLTWETGNNANLCLLKLSQNVQNLSGYREITVHIFLEDYSNVDTSGEASAPTLAKLAIQGKNGTIWQTRTVKSEKLPADSAYKLRFRLSAIDMERVEGAGTFPDTIGNIKNVRLRFENSKRSGFRQDAYIDSITAVQ